MPAGKKKSVTQVRSAVPTLRTSLFELIANAQRHATSDLAVTRMVASVVNGHVSRMGQSRVEIDLEGIAAALAHAR